MSGFLNKLKDKALSSAGLEDKATDALTKVLGSGVGQAGVEKLIQQFDSVGLGDKARSWVGPGPAQSLTTEELQRVLTSDQAKLIASCTGLPLAPLLPVLAKVLPVAIEKIAKKDKDGDKIAVA
ncbi:YidB family protein [Acetobacter sp. DmW_043]|uniref:YidB family protein n=1 Tax=Acetobacter sp. DmW_043 TaxID=1670658 RepID=UPI000A3A9788|nr:YidB family protein [Acetobacter sp. DmW_043]